MSFGQKQAVVIKPDETGRFAAAEQTTGRLD